MFFFTNKSYAGSHFIVFLTVLCVYEATAQFCKNVFTNKKNSQCSASIEVDNGLKIEWPSTSNGKVAFSFPLCLDANKNPIVRMCCNGIWSSNAEKCSFYTFQFSRKCPRDYSLLNLANSSICISKTYSSWSSKCIKSGTEIGLPHLTSNEKHRVIKHLKQNNINALWLPVKRDEFGSPLIWFLAGSLWKQQLKDDYIFQKTIDKGGNCLKMHLGNNETFELSNCEEKLPVVCVYQYEPLISTNICKNGGVTRYSPQNHCYWIENSNSHEDFNNFTVVGAQLFDVTVQDSIYIFQNLTQNLKLKQGDMCLVKGPKSDLKYVLDEKGKLSVIPLEAKPNCVIHQSSLINIRKPELVLKYNQNKPQIVLTVYALEHIWKSNSKNFGIKCFSDAERFPKEVHIVRLIWNGNFTVNDNEIINKHIFEVKISEKGVGYHWCECFALPNFTLITSNKIIASQRPSLIFSTLFAYSGAVNFNKKGFKNITRGFKDNLNYKESLLFRTLEVRLMKVISGSNGTTLILFHLNLFHNESKDNIQNYYEAKVLLTQLLSSVKTSLFSFISLNSTKYCLPDTNNRQWTSALVGSRGISKDFCLQSNGLPLSFKCIGDFLYGGVWEKLNHTEIKCEKEISDITKMLSNITIESSNLSKLVGDMSQMTKQNSKIIPADIYFLSKTIQTISQVRSFSAAPSEIDKKYYDNLLRILSNLQSVNEPIVKQSQNLNATNMLLFGFDEITKEIPANKTEDGTTMFVCSKILVFVTEPSIANISGIALITKTKDTGNFNDFYIQKLYANDSYVEILKRKNLELATLVPQDLLNRINEIKENYLVNFTEPSQPIKIIITVYYNDLLFQSTDSSNQQEVLSKIVSVQIPNYSNDLPSFLPIILKTTHPKGHCGYWSSNTWSSDGAEYLASVGKLYACGFSHMTPFSYLMASPSYSNMPKHRTADIEIHAEALDIITFIGCTLSLFGIFGIVVTAVIFKNWREKPSTKVLLNLSAAISLEMVLIAFVNTEAFTKDLLQSKKITNCVVLGVALHYSILVAFVWMLITAFLQFMRFVKVLGEMRPRHFLLKSSLVGWGGPLIPVLITVSFDYKLYVPSDISVDHVSRICYPKQNALYLGLLFPVSIIVISNFVIFIIVIYNIFKIPKVNIRNNERRLLVSQLRLSINLFFLLGLSWLFGLATTLRLSIIFSYLFCLTATLQGFSLFFFFVIMDPVTRKSWKTFLMNLGFNCFKRSTNIE